MDTQDLLGAASSESVGVKKSASPTVSAQFKNQLADLMSYLDSTVPHYIRCIGMSYSLRQKFLNLHTYIHTYIYSISYLGPYTIFGF